METIEFTIKHGGQTTYIQASADCYPPTWFSPSAYTRMLNVDAYTSDDSGAQWIDPKTFGIAWAQIVEAAEARLLAPWNDDDSDRFYDCEREGA